ncbi:hypothetical protein Hanom_Chr07g00615041 [Helianthus anomalus]
MYLDRLRVVLWTTRHIPTLTRCLSQATHSKIISTTYTINNNQAKTRYPFTNPS